MLTDAQYEARQCFRRIKPLTRVRFDARVSLMPASAVGKDFIVASFFEHNGDLCAYLVGAGLQVIETEVWRLEPC